MSENKVLMGVTESRTDAITGVCRKLHTDELHGLHSSPNTIRVFKSRRMRWAGRIARVGNRRNACRFLVGKPGRKNLPGTPTRSQEDHIKMDLRD
jgi:hypothetical protein